MKLGPFQVSWSPKRRAAGELVLSSPEVEGLQDALLDKYPLRTPDAVKQALLRVFETTSTTLGEHTQASDLILPMTETLLLCGVVGNVKAGMVIVTPTGLVTHEISAKTVVIFGRVGLNSACVIKADHIVICAGARLTKATLEYTESNSMHPDVALRDASLVKATKRIDDPRAPGAEPLVPEGTSCVA